MKLVTIFATVAILFSSNAFSNSNITEGTTSISGSISYSQFDTDTGPKTKDLVIAPKYLYFIKNNIGIGALLGYSHRTFDGTKFEGYGIGPFMRYYLQGEDTVPYISLEYVHSYLKGSGDNVVSFKNTTKQKSIGFGLNHFIATNVALETELKYSSADREDEINPSNINSDYTNTSFNIGVNVFFP